MPSDIEADIIVVGSGIGGSLVAYKAATQGKTVALLERGPRLAPEVVAQIFNRHTFQINPPIPVINVTKMNRQQKIAERYLPLAVGGLANFYMGVSLRMREKDYHNWPLTYSEVEPYYSEAEQLLNVAGRADADSTEPPRSQTYPFTLPEMSETARRLQRGAQAIDINPFPHPLAIRFDKGCRRCFYCNQVSCPWGVKFTPIHLLNENANLAIRLFPQHMAQRIRISNRGRFKRVDYIEGWNQKDNQPVRCRGKAYILCGGALQTPLLMIRSGLQEHNPLIGTHLMTHCMATVWGIFPDTVSGSEEFDKWLTVSDFYFDDQGGVQGLIQQEQLIPRNQLLNHVPRLFHWLVQRYFPRVCSLLVIAEDEPRIENRVEIGESSGVIIRQNFTQRDIRKRDFLVRKAKTILKSAGARVAVGRNGHTIYHACGTCRMGESEKTSVTDRSGNVWGVENLFVADASLMPTSSGVNPSLTIAALALRIGDIL
jgi:choline dehydrogenase-like flavoprotein